MDVHFGNSLSGHEFPGTVECYRRRIYTSNHFGDFYNALIFFQEYYFCLRSVAGVFFINKIVGVA